MTGTYTDRSGCRLRKCRGGFALIIALVLMGFMLLLVLSLSSLLMVESQTSTASRTVEDARKNALLGLYIALGELQRTAGQDQRVSARADITATTPLAHPHWTGVWKSTAPDAVNTAGPVSPAGAGYKANANNRLNPSEVGLINWLVSGNEQTDLAGNPSATARHRPEDALGADLSGAAGVPGIVLVGASTLQERGSPEADSLTIDGAVIAPKVDIRGDGNDLTGHYAWWVGDEGVKARVRLNALPSGVAGSAESRTLAFQLPVAARPALMTGLGFYDGTRADLDRLLEYSNLTASMAQGGAERTSLNARWHDLSLSSLGLLTDTRWGGFRGDLTLAFENESVFNRYFNEEDDTFYFVMPEAFGYTAGFPNWKNLYSYYNLKGSLTNGALRSQMARPLNPAHAVYAEEAGQPYINNGPTARESYHDNSPVSALIARLQITVGIQYVEVPDPANPTSVRYSPVLLIKPLAGAYNPYNATLLPPLSNGGSVLSQQYRWAFLPLFTVRVFDASGSLKSENNLNGVSFRLREVLSGETVATPASDLIMKLPSVDIEPGETRLFGLWEDVDRADFVAQNQTLSLDTGANQSDLYDPMAGFMVLPLQTAFVAADNGATEAATPKDKRFGLTADEKHYLLVEDTDRIELTINASSPGAVWYNYSSSPAGVTASNSHVQFFYDVANGAAVGGANPTSSVSFYVTEAIAPAGGIGAKANLLTWGFWLRTAGDVFAASRLLVDHNIRTIAAPHSWDVMNDNFYMSSVFTGEFDGDQAYGYLDTPLPNILGNSQPGGRFTGFWGGGRMANDGSDRVVLFDVPRSPLLSLGALQHANIGRYSFDPSYVVGNSFAPARIRDLQNAYDRGGYRSGMDVWDFSYIVNQQLWDSYYFSGISATLSDDEVAKLARGTVNLPNHRLRLGEGAGRLTAADLNSTDAAADTFYRAASHLMVDGAFNINSTSVEAWKALLASSANLSIPTYHLSGAQAGRAGSYNSESGVTFSRLPHPVGGRTDGGAGEGFWRGYRTLSEPEVGRLATEIVRLIRERGKPFGSLADFVNRPLESTSGRGRPGLLQEAIDSANLNGSAPGYTLSSIGLPSAIGHNPVNGANSATAFPGSLTQADILQALGPVLTARSDTFVIRSYGDTVNPANGEVQAQAWCEAVVQRVADEVVDGADVLSRSANRKFRVISFRWLGKDEV